MLTGPGPRCIPQANVLELRQGEVRRMHLPRPSVNTASSSGIIVPIRERSSAEMAEHKRVPNLEELDEKEAYSFLTDVFFYGPIPGPEVVYQANHPEDYAMEMPQSGERIVGRENMRSFHKSHPGSPTIRGRRGLVWEGLWVVEGVNVYGVVQVSDF